MPPSLEWKDLTSTAGSATPMEKERVEILITKVTSCPDSLRPPGSQFKLHHFLVADLGKQIYFSVAWSLICKVRMTACTSLVCYVD